MKKVLRNLILICLGLFIMEFAPACSTTTYVRPAPPPLRVEVRAPRPHAKAVWVPGHWRWKGRRRGRHVWIPGHWKVIR